MPTLYAAPNPPVALISDDDYLRRVRRTSRAMVLACTALIAVLPVALVLYWWTASAGELASQGNLQSGAIQANLQAWQRVMAALVSTVPLGLLLMGIWQARRCFVQFALGQVFTLQAVACLRRFAGWVALAAAAAIIAGAVISVVLTFNNLPGTRQLSFGISSNHLFTVFFAALVWLLADVIGQGQALAQENRQFV